MGGKRKIGFQSALLVTWTAIALSFAGALLMWRFGMPSIGVLLMAVAVTGLMCRMWGLYALRDVEAQVSPDRESLSAGQSVTIRYRLTNGKALPLVWVELLQDIPVRDCLVPREGFVRRSFSPEEAERTGRREGYLRRLAFLPGYGSLEWETEWTGARRGVYRPQDLVLRSGDGLGLTQSTGEVRGMRGRVLVVWPKLVPVRTAPILRHVWSGATGRSGWTEDPTVMRGERAYQPGDPWKRIDWRTAARTDELMVRQYEMIRPLSLLFILDAAALEDPEEGISLLASLLRALDGQGISCGLALPATAQRGPLLLRPDSGDATLTACLFALAEFEAETAGPLFDDGALLAAAAAAGQTWIMTQSPRELTCASLAQALIPRGARLLCARRETGAPGMCSFDELRQREAAV